MPGRMFYTRKGITIITVFSSSIKYSDEITRFEGIEFTKWLIRYAEAFFVLWCFMRHERMNECKQNHPSDVGKFNYNYISDTF